MKTRFAGEPRALAPRRAEAGAPAAGLSRKTRIGERSFRRPPDPDSGVHGLLPKPQEDAG